MTDPIREALRSLHERAESFNPPDGRGLTLPGAYALDHAIGENVGRCAGCDGWAALAPPASPEPLGFPAA